MKTKKEYTDCWNNTFGKLKVAQNSNVNIANTPLDFPDYLKRENMLEDYLDLFRNKDTSRERDSSKNPYFNDQSRIEDELNKPVGEFCISYLLTGEAPPANSANYLYDYGAIGNNAYLGAVFNAQYPTDKKRYNLAKFLQTHSKLDALVVLASRGVLVLDIFPFALQYSTSLRRSLNKTNTSDFFFFDLTNTYSVASRIATCQKEGLFCQSTTKAAFICPPTIARHLSSALKHHNVKGLVFSLNINGNDPACITNINQTPGNERIAYAMK